MRCGVEGKVIRCEVRYNRTQPNRTAINPAALITLEITPSDYDCFGKEREPNIAAK